ARELVDGLTFYADTAHKMGLKVWGGTLLPIYGWRTYAPFREELRNQINDWIKTTDKIDGCIDFDEVLKDINQPQMFADGFDSGDHLHPSLAAYKAMAQIIPQQLFK
ncbi:MAG: lipase, partial [Spirochaetota bacterium]|nr:lipase [Spirochaetota bacterium]